MGYNREGIGGNAPLKAKKLIIYGSTVSSLTASLDGDSLSRPNGEEATWAESPRRFATVLAVIPLDDWRIECIIYIGSAAVI
jgi:hypothetical protein